MTDTAHTKPPAHSAMQALPLTTMLPRQAGETLIDQITRSVAGCIDDRLLRTGARMPSIRQFAQVHGVSCFTVVASYDKLVAKGYLVSRQGAGFFVRERTPQGAAARMVLAQQDGATSPDQGDYLRIDAAWLVRNMFRQVAQQPMPGAGVLPAEWLDGASVANALRAVSRQHHSELVSYGEPQGYLPLRQQLQHKLMELEISAAPAQIVTTVGVTQALDLLAREFLHDGDTVFVDDPAWFLMFGVFAAMGARVVGIPRLADGPDLEQLAALAALHKPKLYVINSVLHNPTSTMLSGAKAYQILRIAEEHDITVVEDDIYCDLHSPTSGIPAARLAALDQLHRVVYLGGFSKTMAPNLRVGFIAASPALAARLADRKMLATLTTSDIGEQVVHKILSAGLYRKHVERIRVRLDTVRSRIVRQMERVGLKADSMTPAGMFVWADAGCDTNVLAERAMAEGILLAPGSLFSSNQLPSTRLRLNLAAMQDPAVWRFFDAALGR